MEFVAVNQCSGNGRGYFTPRVNGGQLSNGAMGNARWTGVPLKKVLEKAGIQAGAVQVTFGGLDRPPLESSPGFVKALAIEHALDGEVMLAWAMNGEDLPMLNGYPLRLVVPGYYGTYWVKHVSDINVLDQVYDGFWMSRAYRIPDNPCACVEPGTAPTATIPINRFNVRSFVTSLADGGKGTRRLQHHGAGNCVRRRPRHLRGCFFGRRRPLMERCAFGSGPRQVLLSDLGGADSSLQREGSTRSKCARSIAWVKASR